MRVLVLGALGFIGRQIVATLLGNGHSVVAAVRAARITELPSGVQGLACDLQRDLDPALWLPRLDGVDAVVNAAGLLRGSDSLLDAVHHLAPLALARAASERGLHAFVQISALGDPADGEFVASKHRADTALLDCDLPVTVFRPSLVYALTGSYGGSSLLRALASLPLLLPLPGKGTQPVQPVHVRDLAHLVLQVIESDASPRGIHTVVGPQRMGIGEFLVRLRRWMGWPRAVAVPLPMFLVRAAGAVGEQLGDGPLGNTMVRMLARGNAADADTHAKLAQTFGHAPQALVWWMQQEPSQVQDRWHARLLPLGTLLRLGLGAMCLLSAVAGFAQSPAQISLLAAPLGWPEWLAWLSGYGASLVDALLGAMLIANWRALQAGRLLLLLVLVYTVLLGWRMPGLWLDPWGALAKNLVILPALLMWLVLAQRR